MIPRRTEGPASEPRFYSLATRVGVELVILTVVLNLLLGALVTWFWMSRQREQLDERLLQIARQVSAQIQPDGSGSILNEASASGLTGEPLIVVVRELRGGVVRSLPPDIPKIEFRPGEVGAPAYLSVSSSGDLADLMGNGKVRLLTAPSRGSLYVQVGLSQARLDDLERTLRVVFVGIIPLLTAGASLAAWLVAGRRLARLRQVSELARDISPGRLGRRLDEAEGRDELGRLAVEVNGMLGRLEAGFQAQDRFISEVSHELKTPVSVMLLEAQVLMRSSPDPVTYARFVSSVEDEMRRLHKLIESFLTLARAGHGDTHLRSSTVDMNATCMEAAQHCWQLARLRGIRLAVTLVGEEDCPDEPTVSGDPELLRTMIENLVRNAVSVSARQSAVDLRVACEHDHVTVRVRDHGPGVPDAVAPRIFDRFVTADPSGAGRKGEGLGLTIARSIAKLHGGSVGFRNLSNEGGGGAEFFASIPLRKESQQPDSAARHDL